MLDPTTMDAIGTHIGKIGGWVGGIGAAILGGWVIFQRTLGQAKIATAEKSLAISQETLYTQLTQRINSLEEDYKAIREELRVERESNRALALQNQRLELHIIRLESLMRSSGIEVPVFSPASSTL